MRLSSEIQSRLTQQALIAVKDRDPARVDNPFLIEELSEERPGILLWMLEGLHRLLANRYQFTISERSIQNLEAAMADSDNLTQFMQASAYVRKNFAKLTREDLKIAPESPTMERQELAVPCEFSVRNSMVISDETSDQTPAVEPSDQTSKTVRHAPLVYRVEEIAQLLAISNRAAYNLCNTTKDFKVIRLGTSIRVSKQSFDDWFAAV